MIPHYADPMTAPIPLLLTASVHVIRELGFGFLSERVSRLRAKPMSSKRDKAILSDAIECLDDAAAIVQAVGAEPWGPVIEEARGYLSTIEERVA